MLHAGLRGSLIDHFQPKGFPAVRLAQLFLKIPNPPVLRVRDRYCLSWRSHQINLLLSQATFPYGGRVPSPSPSASSGSGSGFHQKPLAFFASFAVKSSRPLLRFNRRPDGLVHLRIAGAAAQVAAEGVANLFF